MVKLVLSVRQTLHPFLELVPGPSLRRCPDLSPEDSTCFRSSASSLGHHVDMALLDIVESISHKDSGLHTLADSMSGCVSWEAFPEDGTNSVGIKEGGREGALCCSTESVHTSVQELVIVQLVVSDPALEDPAQDSLLRGSSALALPEHALSTRMPEWITGEVNDVLEHLLVDVATWVAGEDVSGCVTAEMETLVEAQMDEAACLAHTWASGERTSNERMVTLSEVEALRGDTGSVLSPGRMHGTADQSDQTQSPSPVRTRMCIIDECIHSLISEVVLHVDKDSDENSCRSADGARGTRLL
jgi:hypothetical protein